MINTCRHLLDHLAAILSNLMTTLKISPKALSPLQTTYSLLKLGTMNLLLLVRLLTMKIWLKKYFKANYQSIIDVVNGRDSTISFDELHEKLINKELSLRNKTSPSPLSASVHPINVRCTPWSTTNCTSRLLGLTSTPTQGHKKFYH